MKKVINSNMGYENNGVYRAYARFTTPEISRLKRSARSKLYYLKKKARDHGFSIYYELTLRIWADIEEMASVEQYEDFVEDCKSYHESLDRAIRLGQDCGNFFKIN